MKPFAIFFLLALFCVTVADARTDTPTRISGPAVQARLANPITQDLLWDQFDGTVTNAYTAQNFEAGFEIYDNEMADDITVPAGYQWLVEELVYYGIYYNCGTTGLPPCGPTESWDVTIYNDAGGMPGSIAAGPYNIVATQVLDTLNQYFFVLTLPAGVVVGSGTYWVGATANMAFADAGQIGIGDNDVLHGSMARWRNPGDGFVTGCSSWGVAQTCFAAVPPNMTDYSWQLYGQSQIACEDIRSFTAVCKRTGVIRARAAMTDLSHAGDMVTFIIDGDTHDATVLTGGGLSRAQVLVPGFPPGFYTVELVNPTGCYEEIVVECVPRMGAEELEQDEDEIALAAVTPQETSLRGNYPNPFNPSTTINYALGQNSWVSLKVYNTLGQEVATLVNDFQQAGAQSAVWNGRNEYGATVASGIYIYRLTTDNVVLSEKMLFMK